MELMKRELINYDIFPKVIPVGKEVTVTIKPMGGHAAFTAGTEYTNCNFTTVCH